MTSKQRASASIMFSPDKEMILFFKKKGFPSDGSKDFIDCGAGFDEVFINARAKETNPLIANSGSRAN